LRSFFRGALTLGLVLAMGTALLEAPGAQAQDVPPDIILIVTDDQRYDSMRHMPFTRSLTPLVFTKALVANPVCCPSRATILSGRWDEETGVWTNVPPHGGFPAFAAWDAANVTLPEALNPTYHTGYAGKYFNAWDGSLPAGWDGFWGIRFDEQGPRTPYYGYEIMGTDPPISPPDHVLHALTERLVEFVNTAPRDAPIFAYFAAPSPHNAGGIGRPIPAPEDVGTPVALQRLPKSVNEANVADKPAYIRKRKTLSETEIDRHRRAVARTLRSTDRSIAKIVAAQEARDPGLANTVVIFTSDNGLLAGEHRWIAKAVPYEEALRVPMRIRVPGVEVGRRERLVTNVDIPATVAALAGVAFDIVGRSLLEASGPSTLVIRGAASTPRAFCGLRTARWKYVRYRTGEAEGYDLRNDPWELRSRPWRVPVHLVERALQRCQRIEMPNWAARR
jgi:arylsulfatase A-like enzyme